MKQDLVILRGKTFQRVVRWESTEFAYAPITGITKAAPAVVTATAHGVPNGWRVAIVSVQGMTEINAPTPPRDRDFVKATVTNVNTIELNSVNSSEFAAYESGGYVQYYTPTSLAGASARMQIKDKVGGTVLASTDVDDLPFNVITITLDDANKTISVTIAATDTAAFTWARGVYDLEVISSTGVVTALLFGAVSVTAEVTTST